MKEGNMLEVAFKALQNAGEPMKFTDLWATVKEELEITPEEEEFRLGHFYTDLSLNGSRFVVLTDNTWDLRSRHTYDAVHINVDDVYTEIQESDEDATDKEEDRKYNESVNGAVSSSEEEGASEFEEGEESKPISGKELLGIKDEPEQY